MNRTFTLLLILFTFSAFHTANAQTSISSAQAIFIYNFTRLTEWPVESRQGDFVIGVYGSADIYNEIKSYTTGKTVGNQPIATVRFTGVETIKKCHILFVSFGKTKELPVIMGVLGGSKTLIITEKKGALDEGAAINFTIIEDKLKFEIKTSNATKMGLKIHSNLENMAIAKY